LNKGKWEHFAVTKTVVQVMHMLLSRRKRKVSFVGFCDRVQR